MTWLCPGCRNCLFEGYQTAQRRIAFMFSWPMKGTCFHCIWKKYSLNLIRREVVLKFKLLNLEIMSFFPYLSSFPSVECYISVCKKKWTHLFEQGCYLVLLNAYMWMHKMILFCYVLNDLVDVFYLSLGPHAIAVQCNRSSYSHP